MVIPIPSRQQRFRIRLGIRALAPFYMGVRGNDPGKPNTWYFRRKIPFREQIFDGSATAYRELTIPLPVSPDLLLLELFDKNENDDSIFRIENFKVEQMEPAAIWAEPEMHRFIDFAQDFAQKAGYLPPGIYDSPEQEFLIQYLPYMEDEQGKRLATPARTSRKSGRIQASQADFVRYTIPVRVVILFHERYHYQLPTRKEKPADLHGVRLALDLGYPRTEIIYATTKIFCEHPHSVGEQHLTRVQDVEQYIDNYSRKKNLKIHA